MALVRAGRGRQAGWALAFAALHALGVVLFFVNSRYRLPLWPLACAWGGLGCHELVVRVRARDWRRLGTALATAFPLAAVSWSASALLTLPGEDRDHFYRSLARQQNGLLEGALGDARTAVAGDPRDPAYRVQLGNLLLALDRHAEAIRELVAAVRLDPRQPISHSNLGVALEESGDVAGARAAYGAALSQAPDYRPARENLALLELSEGRFEAAREALSGGPIAGEPSARGLAAAGLVALAAGECDAGEELLDRARALDREAVDAIVTRIGSRGHRPPGVC
jgi:Flp pilus assembly protein TadD